MQTEYKFASSTITLYRQYQTDFTIDWGDGSSEFIDESSALNGHLFLTHEYDQFRNYNIHINGGSSVTYLYMLDDYKNIIRTKAINANDYLSVKHTFAHKGIYTVQIDGICDNLYGYNENVYEGNKRSPSLIKCLWGVQIPKGKQSPLKYAHGSFFGCENLTYLGYGVFDNLRECKQLYHTFDGAVIKNLYPYLLKNATNLQSLSYAFENCQMTTIDKDLFKNCTKVTDCSHIFHRCNRLKQIPNGLFDSMQNLTNVDIAFQSCSQLEIVPENLFDKNPNITSAIKTFSGGAGSGGDSAYPREMKIKTKLPPLWNRPNEISHEKYAFGCVKSANYLQAVSKGWT